MSPSQFLVIDQLSKHLGVSKNQLITEYCIVNFPETAADIFGAMASRASASADQAEYVDSLRRLHDKRVRESRKAII